MVPGGVSRVAPPPGMTAPRAPAGLALRLHTSDDPNGNSFVSSSCSSSSSSSFSCSSSPPREASPDSLSSPSGEGWADDHMLEVTVTTTVAPGCPEEAESSSVYLDAHTGRTWSDHNDNHLLIAGMADCGFDDLGEGRGCSTPDSDATEILADNDDDDEADEEESLFLSVSSELSIGTQLSPPILEDSCSLTPSTLTPNPPSSSSPFSSSFSSSTNQLSDCRHSDVEVCLKTTSPPPRAPDQPSPAKAPVSAATKAANQEARRVRRPDLKNIKAKVMSRPAPLAAKLSNQVSGLQAMYIIFDIIMFIHALNHCVYN